MLSDLKKPIIFFSKCYFIARFERFVIRLKRFDEELNNMIVKLNSFKNRFLIKGALYRLPYLVSNLIVFDI